MSLLDQNTTIKKRVDKKTIKQLEFETGGDNEEYKVEDICDNAVYIRESKVGYLLGLYYLVSWKSYHEDESTWEPALAV